MIGWPRIPSPIIRTEIRFVRSRPLARLYRSSTLCGCSLRTPPRTPGHMNRAAVATPSTANRPRSLDPVDFTSLNSRGDLWPLSPHTFTDPVPAGAVHPSRHGIDQPSRAATASMRPATTNGRGSISDVMPATVRRAGTSQGKTGGRSGFGMPSLPSGPAEFATYSPGPTSECWSHRRGNASASPVLPLSCIITRQPRLCSEATRKAIIPSVLSIQAEFALEPGPRPRSKPALCAAHTGDGRAPSPNTLLPKGSSGRAWDSGTAWYDSTRRTIALIVLMHHLLSALSLLRGWPAFLRACGSATAAAAR